MLVVSVELHSAVTSKVTQIAKMHISNDGTGNPEKGNYWVRTFRGRNRLRLLDHKIQREGFVNDFPRKRKHAWSLVAAALKTMGYE
jgi:hypothetical protein